MTQDGWKQVIMAAGHDREQFDLLAQLLAEQDAAKEQLRRLGFGVTGSPWRDIVENVREATVQIAIQP